MFFIAVAFQIFRIGNERVYIRPIGTDVVVDDELLRARYIHVVSRLELTIAHMVFFHVHESGVMICFEIAVAVSADVQILCVFLPLLQPAAINISVSIGSFS